MPFRSAEAERAFIAGVPGLPQEQESVSPAIIGHGNPSGRDGPGIRDADKGSWRWRAQGALGCAAGHTRFGDRNRPRKWLYVDEVVGTLSERWERPRLTVGAAPPGEAKIL
jgi:hypothetical protein